MSETNKFEVRLVPKEEIEIKKQISVQDIPTGWIVALCLVLMCACCCLCVCCGGSEYVPDCISENLPSCCCFGSDPDVVGDTITVIKEVDNVLEVVDDVVEVFENEDEE